MAERTTRSLAKRAALKAARLRVVDTGKLYAAWEETHLRRLLSHLDVDCVFDVGANDGQYAQMLRKKADYKGRIISFEPIPASVATVRKLSTSDPLWTVEETALADMDGTRTFNIMAQSQFSSLSKPRHDESNLFSQSNKVASTVDVKTETLETAYHRLKQQFGFRKPFLKLDTQGFDVTVVRSGLAIIEEFVGLQSELAIRRLYDDARDFREAIAVYENAGFALSAFVPNNAGHFPIMIETDCIMIRQDLA